MSAEYFFLIPRPIVGRIPRTCYEDFYFTGSNSRLLLFRTIGVHFVAQLSLQIGCESHMHNLIEGRQKGGK